MKALKRRLKGRESPEEIVSNLKTNIAKLLEDEAKEVSEEEKKKTDEKISSDLGVLKFMLYGDTDTEPKEENRKKITTELVKGPILDIILNLRRFNFEGKKDAAKVANHVIRRSEANNSKPLLKSKLKEITQSLILCYENTENALPAGQILQEIVKQEAFATELMGVPTKENIIFSVMKYVEKTNFDIASDAFTTLKLLTTKHKVLMSKWFEANYDVFFTAFNALINSENYVTRRQSLRLLGEILLERKNFQVMMKYIKDRENLKLMMNMLKNKSKAIQFEAFHVFKVFVANPKQTYPVKLVLWNNKARLIKFLETFQKEKEDQQFINEKELVIQHLKAIERPEDPKASKTE